MMVMKIFQKYALGLDVGQYITFNIDSSFKNMFKDGITVAFWYKGLGWGDPTKYDYLVHFSGRWVNNTIDRIAFYIDEKYIRFYWGVKDYTYRGSSLYKYNDGKWHFYVGIVGHNRMAYYVDGVLISELALSDNNLVNVVSFESIGASRIAYNHQVVGNIADLRLYNRPLTEEEIQYLYKGGHIVDGLVFWLHPDEESVTLDSDGQTVLSITEKVNGYVGTAYNGVKLVDGKDVDEAKSKGKRYIIVRKV